MTKPRIEEMVEHCTKMKPKFLETENWVEYIVRYAHKAGYAEGYKQGKFDAEMMAEYGEPKALTNKK